MQFHGLKWQWFTVFNLGLIVGALNILATTGYSAYALLPVPFWLVQTASFLAGVCLVWLFREQGTVNLIGAGSVICLAAGVSPLSADVVSAAMLDSAPAWDLIFLVALRRTMIHLLLFGFFILLGIATGLALDAFGILRLNCS